MSKDLWLPIGFALTAEASIRCQLYAGAGWQIYATNDAGNALVTGAWLMQKWLDYGLLDAAMFFDVDFGDAQYKAICCKAKYALMPIDSGIAPQNKVDALAFAYALRESRNCTAAVAFNGGIYLEQYSRLLPADIATATIADDVLLGRWLTGGVNISVTAFERLVRLSGSMNAAELAEVITKAGFSAPADLAAFDNKALAKSPRRRAAQRSLAQSSAGEAKVFKLSGRPVLENFFNEHIIDIIQNPDKYQPLGIDFPSAVILYGPPGCGKTFAVERLLEFIAWPSFAIDSNSIGSPYIHETSRKIAQVFDEAIASAPAVIVIDEMESFLSNRDAGSLMSVHHVEEVAEFLRRIPEAINNHVLIIAMTNMLDIIDPAILRRGRFDHKIEVGMPSRQEVASLLDALLKELPTASDLNIEPLKDALAGRALSDAAFVIREAARLAAKNGCTEINQDSIDAAFNSIASSADKIEHRIGFL